MDDRLDGKDPCLSNSLFANPPLYSLKLEKSDFSKWSEHSLRVAGYLDGGGVVA